MGGRAGGTEGGRQGQTEIGWEGRRDRWTEVVKVGGMKGGGRVGGRGR